MGRQPDAKPRAARGPLYSPSLTVVRTFVRDLAGLGLHALPSRPRSRGRACPLWRPRSVGHSEGAGATLSRGEGSAEAAPCPASRSGPSCSIGTTRLVGMGASNPLQHPNLPSPHSTRGRGFFAFRRERAEASRTHPFRRQAEAVGPQNALVARLSPEEWMDKRLAPSRRNERELACCAPQ